MLQLRGVCGQRPTAQHGFAHEPLLRPFCSTDGYPQPANKTHRNFYQQPFQLTNKTTTTCKTTTKQLTSAQQPLIQQITTKSLPIHHLNNDHNPQPLTTPSFTKLILTKRPHSDSNPSSDSYSYSPFTGSWPFKKLALTSILPTVILILALCVVLWYWFYYKPRQERHTRPQQQQIYVQERGMTPDTSTTVSRVDLKDTKQCDDRSVVGESDGLYVPVVSVSPLSISVSSFEVDWGSKTKRGNRQ